ncbi:YceI family protein [Photobacterium nomapromontoriensis]|uniref:YceI family protein n=1 Tax=Photobacterium nomapromontoriensis TaxID=2910237 RepID=UPI003D09807E
MKKNLFTLGFIAAISMPMISNAANYQIDTKDAHASINLKVEHLGYSYIKGRFNTFDGNFSYDPQNIAASQVTVTVDMSSFDTNHAERDKHIRSSDFLDVKKYTTATFTSTKVEPEANGRMAIHGNLTLHGQTHPLIIEAQFIGEGDDPWGGYRAGFSGTTRIELADYGIQVMGASSYADLELHVEGIRQ